MIAYPIPLREDLQERLLPPLIRQHVSPQRCEAPVVLRPQLAGLLDRAVDEYRITLLVAPAGSGKTALLRGWAEGWLARGRRVAWVSLAPLLSAPLPFAGMLLAALIEAGALPADLPEWVWQGLAPVGCAPILTAGGPALLPLAWALNQVAASDTPLALILDGYETITDPGTHELIGHLIEHAPAQLRLMIAGRCEPPLPVARLRAAGCLTEIPAEALRWSVDEAGVLLAQTGLSHEQVATLVDYTEGWSAGLYLAGLVVGAGPEHTAAMAEFLGGHRFVLDYLRDEVLACQPAPLQAFLLKSALLRELSPALCERLLADGEPGLPDEPLTYGGEPSSSALLAALVRRGLFVTPVPHRPGTYRYHPLFALMLREELARRCPAWIEPLERAFGERLLPLTPTGRAVTDTLVEPLSEREHEILALIALGCSNREIADRLSIVEGTVKTHLKHIFGKLHATNRTEAVAIARMLRIIL